MEDNKVPDQIKVMFYSIALDKTTLENLQPYLSDYPILHKAILWYKEELEKENIETWIVDKNLIVTESGYKLAISEDIVSMWTQVEQ